LDNVIRTIPVRDAHGDALTLYEYRPAAPHWTKIGLNRAGGTTRLALDTGEEVKRIDDDHFVIVASGDRLTRIKV
jgi:hypothetical protein